MTIEVTLERIAAALEHIASERYARAIADERQVVDEIDAAVLAAATDGALKPGAIIPVTTEQAAPRKRGRPRKTDKTVTDLAVTPVVEAPAAAFDFLGESPAPAVAATITFTIDDVRAALIAYQEKNLKDKTFALIQKFGGTNLNDIPLENYAKLIAASKV